MYKYLPCLQWAEDCWVLVFNRARTSGLLILLDSYIKPWRRLVLRPLDSRKDALMPAPRPQVSKAQQGKATESYITATIPLNYSQSLYLKKDDQEYKGLSLRRSFHYPSRSIPFLCLTKKRNKGGTLLIEN